MQFSTNESTSLEKTTTDDIKPPFTNPKDLEDYYEIPRCINWITTNNFKKVCLQFPDRLLPDASGVSLHLQKELEQTVYILGDTSYESCCVDYVGAAHIDADAIVHYGPVCFGKLAGKVPALMIFEKWQFDSAIFREKLRERFSGEKLVVVLDAEYVHVKEKLEQELNKEISIYYVHDAFDAKNCSAIYVGKNNRKLMHLKATLACDVIYAYDPDTCQIKPFEIDSRIIKRRYFLAEKIKDSKTVGIVVGTLAIKNYLKVVERLKKLLIAHKKKYYIISVGKLTVAKLANFPEIEIYVLISCSMNDVYENRDFYQTIVTPFDVEVALNNKPFDAAFSYDYNDYLDFSEAINVPSAQNQSDVSLITGKIRQNVQELETEADDNQVALKNDGTVAIGSQFLNQRSWKGLEQNLGQTPVTLAEEGRSGTAFNYENEPNL